LPAIKINAVIDTSKGRWHLHQSTQNLSKIDLLILDDWGLEPLKAAQRNDLMEIMDDRHGSRLTVIISQLPT